MRPLLTAIWFVGFFLFVSFRQDGAGKYRLTFARIFDSLCAVFWPVALPFLFVLLALAAARIGWGEVRVKLQSAGLWPGGEPVLEESDEDH